MNQKEKLQKIIDEIDLLVEHRVKRSDAEFQTWYSKAELFIVDQFGENSIQFTQFKKINFSLQMITDYTTPSDYVQRCSEGLMNAKGILNNFLFCMQEEANESTPNLERMFKMFPKIVDQLQSRHNNRESLFKIGDEYDVQDLLHALLMLYYDDIRPEEPMPSHAGSGLRVDFLIKDISTMIEVKKTRNSMTAKELGEEIIIDIEKYRVHPNCKKLYFFVYDPDKIIKNPIAIINDIEENHDFVKVFIES